MLSTIKKIFYGSFKRYYSKNNKFKLMAMENNILVTVAENSGDICQWDIAKKCFVKTILRGDENCQDYRIDEIEQIFLNDSHLIVTDYSSYLFRVGSCIIISQKSFLF